MKVYMVQFDRSTQDNSGIVIELFDTYKKAYERFYEIISNEHNPKFSWAADAFDENGSMQNGYILDEHIDTDGNYEYDCWWNLTVEIDWNIHDFIDLKVMELK